MNKRKLLLRIINNYKNVNFDDFVVIVEAFGFRFRQTNGSHHIYVHKLIKRRISIQNDGKNAKPYQIKQFFAIVDEYKLRMED